jgi:LPXTG-motif cell wall-anchored protein
MTVELPAMADGQYKVLWTAVSLDDQAVERGQYTFNVSAAAASATPTPTPAPADGATGSSNDVLIAIGLAAVLIVAVVGYVFIRGRR